MHPDHLCIPTKALEASQVLAMIFFLLYPNRIFFQEFDGFGLTVLYTLGISIAYIENYDFIVNTITIYPFERACCYIVFTYNTQLVVDFYRFVDSLFLIAETG